MFDDIENLKIISSLHRPCKGSNKIENRNSNSFIIRVTGSVVYDFYDKKIVVNPGEMMFLPRGICYEYEKISEGESVYTSINFDGDIKNAEPMSYSLKNFYDAEYMSNRFSDMWNFGSAAERYRCMSVFYELLSYLSAVEKASYGDRKKFEKIDQAIDYLKEHIYDCSLKTDDLHKLCGISHTYFRQIFVSRFNMNPQSYITAKRLSHAKSIIDSGDYNTIGEVAMSSGFSDALYFSKIFKKTYGCSPSEINDN